MKGLPVAGWGMVSALGLDGMTSCAAARAGIRRARPLPEMVLADPETGEDALPLGHPIDLLTHGFEGKARLLRLLVAGLADVARQAWPDSPAGPGGRDLALYLAIPVPGRIYTDLDEIANVEARESLRAESAEVEIDRPETLAAWLLEKALPLLRWSGPVHLAFVGTGRTGFCEALARAVADQAKTPRLCIVGAVDSLLEPTVLRWLHLRGALKYAGNPVGLEPGEAAAFVVLDPAPGAPRAPGASTPPLLLCANVSEAGGGAAGSALAAALTTAHAMAGLRDSPSWLSLDLDGTPARAADAGGALARLVARWPGFSPRIQTPACSFGDTGAAAGALAMCLALAAWDRRWAYGPDCLLSVADKTRLGTHVLARALEEGSRS